MMDVKSSTAFSYSSLTSLWHEASKRSAIPIGVSSFSRTLSLPFSVDPSKKLSR
uniref:Uncharacterized protein n=1 Tax=Arundo donax TaxID=35708 RepID=A0A0A9FBK9_ARUDO